MEGACGMEHHLDARDLHDLIECAELRDIGHDLHIELLLIFRVRLADLAGLLLGPYSRYDIVALGQELFEDVG